MKRSLRSIIAVLIILLTILQPAAAKVEFSRELYQKLSQNQNPIPRIEIPDYRRTVLKNGMILYLVEDRQLPILMVNGTIRWGRSLESKEIAGISDWMADLMTTGTKNYTEKEFDRYLERNAIAFSLQAEDNYFTFNGNALISEGEGLISLMAEVLRRPNFEADYFNRKKSEWEKGLRHAKTRENNLLNMYFYKNLMGDHPYSFNHDLDLRLVALERITPQSLTEYYNRAILPNHTILFVYGDFDTDRMEELIKRYFGDWEKKEIKVKPAKVKENKEIYGRVLIVDKPDATQAKIKMGYPFYDERFLDRNLEERASFEIANLIFGGGDFESYLMDEIRSEKGYAYDISADFFNRPLGGAYFITTSVKPERAFDTVATIKRIMSDVKTGRKRFSEEEVFKVINQRNAFFPEAFRHRDSVIRNLIANVELKKRDPDYLNHYIRIYNRVTAAKAQKAFAKHAFPEKFFTVIVGKKEALLPQFLEAGIEVKVIEVAN